jgi:hypothetical protein
VSIDARPEATVPSPAIETSWGPLAVIAGGQSGDEALISGTLRIADNCVLLDERGELVLLVWPEDQTEWDSQTNTVRYDAGDGFIATLGGGDTVSFGGGGSSEAEGGMTAESFLESVNWVARPDNQCVADTRWFVGEFVDTTGAGRVDDSLSASTSVPPADDQSSPAWPSTETGAAAECVYQYPDDLADRPVAFDGTVLSISHGAYVDDAGAAPVELVLQVNEVYRGDLGRTVTMHTFDFSGPDQASEWDPTGIRILAAASESLDVMACGFTRPYSAQDAALWADAFAD